MEKQIVDDYYILKHEGDVSLSYRSKDGDSYIDKAPGQLVQYGYNEKFIIVKVRSAANSYFYYIIDRKKDFYLAIEENFRIGPIPEIEYKKVLQPKLNIIMHNVE